MGINNPGGGDSVWTLLHNETLAASGRFDVSGITQVHNILALFLLVRSDEVTTVDAAVCLLNGDTTVTNYESGRILGDTGALNWAASSTPSIARIAGASTPADYFATIRMYIPFYTSTVFNKNIQCITDFREAAADVEVMTHNVQWENTAAVTQVTIQPNGYDTDEFITGSQLLIYGIT